MFVKTDRQEGSTMNRRDMIRSSLAGTVGAAAMMPALGAGSIKKSRLRKLDDSAQVKVAVASGVDYFKRR